MAEALSALWASICRTVVPILVGPVLGWLVSANLPVDTEFEGVLTALIKILLATAYYMFVRLFETYISLKKIGRLFGYAKSADSYTKDQSGKHEAQ